MRVDFNLQKFIEERIGKITPVKVVLGLAAFVIIVNVLSLIIGIFQALLPVAILAVVGYFGYQILQSRAAAEAEAKATQTTAEKTIALEQAEVNRQKVAAQRLAEEAETVVVDAHPAEEEAPRRLAVEETVNPNTGLREANLAQLEAMEQEKIRQSGDAGADAVKAALEERKKRLLGGG